MSTVCEDDALCEAPSELDFPLPFSELPPELQEQAIESFRNSRAFCEHDDSEIFTENLVNDLEYEFGLQVQDDTYTIGNGKTRSRPHLYWDHYHREVEFEADFDLEEFLKHGDPEITKSEGPTAYQPSIAAVRETLALAESVANVMGVEVSWSLRLRCGKYDYNLAEYEIVSSLWDMDASEDMEIFRSRLDEQMAEVYQDACHRCLKIIDDEIDYRYSDEYVREELQANDCWEFDEEGDLA